MSTPTEKKPVKTRVTTWGNCLPLPKILLARVKAALADSTTRALAIRAGVDPWTMSRALAGERLAPESRRKILAAFPEAP